VNPFGLIKAGPGDHVRSRTQRSVTVTQKAPNSWGQTADYYQIDADRMVHVRTYAADAHDGIVVIRMEYDAKTKVLDVETYYTRVGDLTRPIRVIVTETGEMDEGRR
jgi:hypothetical protein